MCISMASRYHHAVKVTKKMLFLQSRVEPIGKSVQTSNSGTSGPYFLFSRIMDVGLALEEFKALRLPRKSQESVTSYTCPFQISLILGQRNMQ